MDEMPSSEFRRRYATLTTPVVVIVNGRPIGQYIPATSILYVDPQPGETVFNTNAENLIVTRSRTHTGSFNSRPFTPVPKTKGK